MPATCVCDLHQLMRGEGHDTFCPENPAPKLLDDYSTAFMMVTGMREPATYAPDDPWPGRLNDETSWEGSWDPVTGFLGRKGT